MLAAAVLTKDTDNSKNENARRVEATNQDYLHTAIKPLKDNTEGPECLSGVICHEADGWPPPVFGDPMAVSLS